MTTFDAVAKAPECQEVREHPNPPPDLNNTGPLRSSDTYQGDKFSACNGAALLFLKVFYSECEDG